MNNLLDETKECMESLKQSADDIVFIGTSDGEYSCSWDEFVNIANFSYDSGFGMQYIKETLTIVFRDGSRMVRREYDGSEWWDGIGIIDLSKPTKKLQRLIVD
jgi:hypothetical protein